MKEKKVGRRRKKLGKFKAKAWEEGGSKKLNVDFVRDFGGILPRKKSNRGRGGKGKRRRVSQTFKKRGGARYLLWTHNATADARRGEHPGEKIKEKFCRVKKEGRGESGGGERENQGEEKATAAIGGKPVLVVESLRGEVRGEGGRSGGELGKYEAGGKPKQRQGCESLPGNLGGSKPEGKCEQGVKTKHPEERWGAVREKAEESGKTV